MAIFKKDVATLSQKLNRILLYIHLYNTNIVYKPEAQSFIADWLPRHNHNEGKDEEIPGMALSINAMEMCQDIPQYMTAKEIKYAMQTIIT